jgi:hypothetical protein
MKRLSSIAAAALLLAAVAAPVSAQTGGGNGNGNNNNGSNSANESCTQSTSGAGGSASGTQANRSDSRQALVGVIDALINVQGVDLNVVANALNSSNVQVVCLNDVLNQNDISILNDVLSGDNVLNNSLNNDLNNLAQNALQNADVSLLNNVQILTVDVGGSQPQIFLLHR